MNPANQHLLGLSRLQERALELKQRRPLTENQSLNLAASEQGFSDYQAYLDTVRKQAIQMMLYQNGREHKQRLSS